MVRGHRDPLACRRIPASSHPRIAYLLGHYPRTSQTFIRDEIRAIEALGLDVLRVSVNLPDAPLLADEEIREQERTSYIKAVPRLMIVRAILRALFHNPSAFAHALKLAVRSAGTDLRRVVWGCLYFLEAMVVWEHCASQSVTRLHAHFAYPVSTVAWLAAEYGSRADENSWMWSMTIHGPHDFYDESLMLLDDKIESVGTIVCISDYGRSQVLRQIPQQHWHKVVVRRCGIFLDRFPSRSQRPIGRPPVILIVARLSPEKGHLVLLEALGELRNRGLAARLEIVGDGPARDSIAVVADRLGIGGSIALLGALPPRAVAQRLAEADVFCLPSFAEGIPISLMEAMAIGVPVVTTAVGGVPELVENGATGFIVAPGRPDQLADALARLFESAALRAEVVAAARARIEADHDLATNSRELASTLMGSEIGLGTTGGTLSRA